MKENRIWVNEGDGADGFWTVRSKRFDRLEDFMAKNEIIDIRSVWMHPYNGKFFRSWPLAKSARLWMFFKSAKRLSQSYENAEGNQVLIFDLTRPDDEEKSTVNVVFDRKHQMPISIEEHFESKSNAEKSVGGRAKITWSSRNDIFVPTNIQVVRGYEIEIAGEEEFGVLEQSMDFHWFSINEGVETMKFTQDSIKSSEKIASLVDPRFCGADSLLEGDEDSAKHAEDTEAK